MSTPAPSPQESASGGSKPDPTGIRPAVGSAADTLPSVAGSSVADSRAAGPPGRWTGPWLRPGSLLLPSVLPAAFGRYELRQQLGSGGMGAVYLAHDRQLDRLVALKIPAWAGQEDPELSERF